VSVGPVRIGDKLTLVVDWAELVTIELDRFDQPGGKEELVKRLEHAVKNVGTYRTTDLSTRNASLRC
jgi:hypothetical protein